jgi:hypothetical protein
MSDRRLWCDEFTNLTMRDIEDLGSAILVKFQDNKIANHDHSPFWESFTWQFTASTRDNLDNIVDFALLETSSTNNKRSRNYWCLKI